MCRQLPLDGVFVAQNGRYINLDGAASGEPLLDRGRLFTASDRILADRGPLADVISRAGRLFSPMGLSRLRAHRDFLQ